MSYWQLATIPPKFKDDSERLDFLLERRGIWETKRRAGIITEAVQKYRVRVKPGDGLPIMDAIVYAENSTFAGLLIRSIFGTGSLLSRPRRVR